MSGDEKPVVFGAPYSVYVRAERCNPVRVKGVKQRPPLGFAHVGWRQPNALGAHDGFPAVSPPEPPRNSGAVACPGRLMPWRRTIAHSVR